ncbi:hypothetical protein FQA47_024258 [Oryzias melastigma]|uniref:InaF motif containing 2 n=1 Tax=Oryzias melastigma TaxID=30732 RepID=A0A834BXN7_ORYME|nr:hypothetical protein FQA47_024258 [Oryzias melastigma]
MFENYYYFDCFILKISTGNGPPAFPLLDSGPVYLVPGKRRRVHSVRYAGGSRRSESRCPAALQRRNPAGSELLLCGDSPLLPAAETRPRPDSDEQTSRRGAEDSSAPSEMKAVGRQSNSTVEKMSAERRPSYPGELLRAKHANMSTKIWVKVAMAIAYFLCVSVAAFILVIYYTFFWMEWSCNNSTLPNCTRLSG